MMPQFMQQLQNPAVQSMMTNPEALAAINQVQQGLQRLQAASPDLYRSEHYHVCLLPRKPLETAFSIVMIMNHHGEKNLQVATDVKGIYYFQIK